MKSHLSAFATQPRHRSFRRALLAPSLALLLALPCAPLLADQVDEVVSFNATSAPQEVISWMSGGIGDDARDEMRKAAAAYNVHLVFSDPQGHYLADIPFKVARRDGSEIYSGVSEGPLLYLKLPAGSYQITAEIDGVWQSKRIQAGASGRSARMVFIARGE